MKPLNQKEKDDVTKELIISLRQYSGMTDPSMRHIARQRIIRMCGWLDIDVPAEIMLDHQIRKEIDELLALDPESDEFCQKFLDLHKKLPAGLVAHLKRAACELLGVEPVNPDDIEGV